MSELYISGHNINASHTNIALSLKVYPHIQLLDRILLRGRDRTEAEWIITRIDPETDTAYGESRRLLVRLDT